MNLECDLRRCVLNRSLNFLFTISIILPLFYIVTRNEIFLVIMSFMGMLILTYYLIKHPQKYLSVLIVMIFFLLIYLIKLLYLQDIGFFYVFITLISNIGFAIHIIENQKSFKMLLYIYFIMNLIFIYSFFNGITPRDFSESFSENTVNYIFLLFSVLIIGVYYKRNSQIIIIPALLSTILSFWTMGRSGIISSVIILIGVILLKYKNKLNKLSFSLILIFISVFGYYLIGLVGELTQNVLYRFGKRTTIVEGSPRLDIIKAYFNDLDLLNILLGQNLKPHYYAGFTNLHNSFLEFHYNFGLGAIIIIVILIMLLIHLFISKQYLYLILMFGLLFRSMTDTLLFNGLFDYVWIYFILVFIQDKYIKSNKDQYKTFD